MATYIPNQDSERNAAFQNLTSILMANREMRRKRQEEERLRQEAMDRRSAYQRALEQVRTLSTTTDAINTPAWDSLQANLFEAGKEDELDDLTKLIMNTRQTVATRGAARAYAESLPEGDTVREASVPNISVEQQSVISNMRQTERNARQQERKITVYRDGQEKEIFVPKSLQEGGIDAFVESRAPGFTRVKPDDAGEGSRTETETERDIKGILMLRGMEYTEKNKAKARNLLRGRGDANRMLVQDYGGNVVTDPLGNITSISFRGEDSRIKYGIARQLIDDQLLAGGDVNDVVGNAEKIAEKTFNTGGWIPKGVQDGGYLAVKDFLESKDINAPNIIQYFRDLVEIETNADAYRRVLTIRNPDAPRNVIEEAVRKRFPVNGQ